MVPASDSRNIRPGEVAEAIAQRTRRCRRAWRVRGGMPGQALVQGNHELHAPLRFVRVEPEVQPKTSLTGVAAERTDTRVLKLIYSFDPKTLPVYIGQ